MDDETLAECFYETLLQGRHDDTAIDLLRQEITAGDLSDSDRAKAATALDTLTRVPRDGEAIQVLYVIFRSRQEFVRRMALKFGVALAGKDPAGG
jgi:hypothetical protein